MNIFKRYLVFGAGLAVSVSLAWAHGEAAEEPKLSINPTIEEGSACVTDSQSALHTYNLGQAWGLEFDGKGFQVYPQKAGWTWGLELESFGFAGAHQERLLVTRPLSQGSKISYEWSRNVEEWYINDARGLEHGFTVQQRPGHGDGTSGALLFDLKIRGGLGFNIQPNGSGVDFVDAKGQVALTYAGLHVFDSLGMTQVAMFESHGDLLRISIDETHAVYPLTIDPIAQQAYLKASNTDAWDHFGYSVAVSGDTVVVGAPREASHATGINGDQSDNSAHGAGAAYVFVRNGTTWSQQAYLKSSHSEAGDDFARSVAIQGDRIVVGAPYEDSAIGINGNGASNGAPNSGAAFVFERVGSVWSQQAILKGAIPGLNDHFGTDVAIDGNRVVVSAPGEDSGSTGVGGNPGDNSALDSGAVFVFEFSGGNWARTAYLKASNTDAGDQFGASVAIHGDRIVVGAPHEDSGSDLVNGSQSSNNRSSRGAAYLFEHSGSGWVQEAYLKGHGYSAQPGHANMRLGSDVDIWGETVVVGAPGESGQGSGILLGPSTGLQSSGSGAVFLFERLQNVWVATAYVKASNARVGTFFGSSVGIDGDVFLVGCTREDSLGVGLNGNPEPTTLPRVWSGAAYSFSRTPTSWQQDHFIKQPMLDTDDSFGHAVSLADGYAVIAAPGEASQSIGIDGDGLDNSASNAGAAYVFHMEAPVGVYCSPAAGNTNGPPAWISQSGSLLIADNDFTLQVQGLPSNQTAYFLGSKGIGFVPQAGGAWGALCLGGGTSIGRHNRPHEIRHSGASGSVALTLDLLDMPLQQSVVAGGTWNFQCWYRDVGASNFSDVLSVRFD